MAVWRRKRNSPTRPKTTRTSADGSGTVATLIPKKKFAGGLPPKLKVEPAGLFARKSPAAVVSNALSVLVPMVGGLNRAIPRLLSWAEVAPVVPPLSSNVKPIQNVLAGTFTPVGWKKKLEPELAAKLMGLKVNPAMNVPGVPPAPSASHIRKRGLADISSKLTSTTEK